ncbi:MAG: PEP-CTERM sorting domain-containing protein [Opitutaceae bacterium]
MKPHLPRLLTLPAILAAFFVVESRAVSFDFSADNDFTNNFQSYNLDAGTPGYAQTGASGVVTWSAGFASTGNFVYDTNGSTAGGVANFVPGVGNTVTVSFDFSTTISGASVGVYFGGSRGSDKLALFNLNVSGNTDRLRFFTGSNLTAAVATSAGSVITTGVTTSSSGATASAGVVDLTSSPSYVTGTTYHATFSLTYTAASTATAVFTISDPSNTLSSFSATATGLSVSSTSGEIGFRTGFSGTGGTTTMDNLSITTAAIPESSTYALLGGAGALGLAFGIRRKRR